VYSLAILRFADICIYEYIRLGLVAGRGRGVGKTIEKCGRFCVSWATCVNRANGVGVVFVCFDKDVSLSEADNRIFCLIARSMFSATSTDVSCYKNLSGDAAKSRETCRR